MAGTYTHGGWKADMAQILGVYRERIGPAMDRMLGGLRRVEAGRTQTAQFEQAIGMATELHTVGEAILATSGAEGDRVGEAQRAAGGKDEVYGDKHAHTRS